MKTIFTILRDFIRSKEIGTIIDNEDIIKEFKRKDYVFSYNDAALNNKRVCTRRSILVSRSKFSGLGFLENLGKSRYKVVKHPAEDFTNPQADAMYYNRKRIKGHETTIR